MSQSKRHFSIEPHGDGYAIYAGRSQEKHGFRLCNVNDFDMNIKQTVGVLDASLLAFEIISQKHSDLIRESKAGFSSEVANFIVELHDEVMKCFEERLK